MIMFFCFIDRRLSKWIEKSKHYEIMIVIIITSSGSRKLRPVEIRFSRGSCSPLCDLKWESFLKLLGYLPKHRCMMYKQQVTAWAMSFGGLDLILWPQEADQREKGAKKKKYRIFIFTFCKCFWSAELEQVSVLLWELQKFQGRKQDQEQFALSGTSKPIHLKMWPLPFWLPCCALDGPDFSRGEPYWVGASSHISPLRVQCPRKPALPGLCSVITAPNRRNVLPTGWVRCRAEWGSEAGLRTFCLCSSFRFGEL